MKTIHSNQLFSAYQKPSRLVFKKGLVELGSETAQPSQEDQIHHNKIKNPVEKVFEAMQEQLAWAEVNPDKLNPHSVEALSKLNMEELFKTLGLPSKWPDNMLYVDKLHRAGFQFFKKNKRYPNIKENKEFLRYRDEYYPSYSSSYPRTFYNEEPNQDKILKAFLIHNKDKILAGEPIRTFERP